MATPIQEAETVIALAERLINDPSLSTAQKAGERLQLHQRLLRALKALLEYHFGYSSEHRRISTLVSRLLEASTPSKDGALTWASDLSPGKAPQFRRALIDLHAHFKRNPP
jgi:hypothetical protein